MAGHNKWSKIKRDKGVNDAKRGAVFTKIGNMIALAAKQGIDPTMNPALALAIEKARIETATDNRNRTLPEVKTALTKNGGTMADSGSVLFQFTRKGVIRLNASGEEALLTILDAGAEDAQEDDNEIIVYTDMKDLHAVRSKLAESGLEVVDAELQYVANNDIEVSDPETTQKLMKVLDALDDLDDVTNVHTNADIIVEDAP